MNICRLCSGHGYTFHSLILMTQGKVVDWLSSQITGFVIGAAFLNDFQV